MVWTDTAPMPRYRVELNAVIHVRYSIEVDASNEQQAAEQAINNAPEESTLWDAQEGTVSQVETEAVEEVE